MNSSTAVRSKAPFVFISGNPASRGHIYRVANPVEGLNRLGAAAHWLPLSELRQQKSKGLKARCVIAHRCAYDEDLDWLRRTSRQSGVPFGFDIDDLIFDAELMARGGIDFIAKLPTAQQQRWRENAQSFRRAMETADFCLTPTQTLTHQAKRINAQAWTIENGFSAKVLALSNRWRAQCPRHGPVRLGYASGTATHAADFATIARPLAATLQRIPQSAFTLVGSLDLSPHRDLLPMQRVECRPMVEHRDLAYELSRFAVNLIPLQTNSVFCDAKSPLKYFEGALAGVPSIATANPTYRELIQQDENGLLAHSPADWQAAMERLAADAPLRRRLADRARELSIGRFHAHRLAEKYLRLPQEPAP